MGQRNTLFPRIQSGVGTDHIDRADKLLFVWLDTK